MEQPVVSLRQKLKNMPFRVWLEIIIIITLCWFPLCYRMDVFAIRQWDEARNAVHTVEMLENQNYLVRYYEGVPETWEPKPPLLIWFQVLSSKLFGLNELAIRFPVILASFCTVLVLIGFFHHEVSRYTGYLAALVLVTSQGYIDRHLARTGDHDVLLVLILTAVILYFYRYLKTDKHHSGLLIFLGILFTLGVLTKSIAALIVVPGLLISVVVFGKTTKLLRDKNFYLALLVFMIIIAGYYCSREQIQPGYLNAVWQWELFPRYANTENKFDSGTFWFYAINFYNSRFTWWIWILIPSVVALPFMLKGEIRRFYFYILINTVLLFVIISNGSKGLWYDGPLYPLFGIIIGLFIYRLVTMVTSLPVSLWLRRLIVGLLLFVLFFFPYKSIIKKVSRTEEYPWDREIYSMSYILREDRALDSLPDPLKVVFEGYNAHLLFYVKAINYSEKRERLLSGNFSTVRSGDDIIISQQQVMDSITSRFNYRIISEHDPVKVIRILE